MGVRWVLGVSFAALVAFAPPGARARAAEPVAALTIDESAGFIHARIDTTGVAAALAHDHVVAATGYRGTVHIDATELEASRISLEIDARALRADEPEVRRQHGLPPLDEDDRSEIQRTMEGPNQLYVEAFPTIRFASTAIEAVGAAAETEAHFYRVEGLLSMHGRERPVRLVVELRRSEAGWHLAGSGVVRQSDFAIEPYAAFLGAVRNEDVVTIRFELVLDAEEATQGK